MKRTAFSLIEIMIVIAVIALLAAIAVIGYKHVGGAMQAKATQTTLANLLSLRDEWQQAVAKQQTNRPILPTEPVASAGLVSEGQPGRTGSLVALSHGVLGRLCTVTANRTAIGNLPSNTQLRFAPAAGLPGWSAAVNYQIGDRVVDGGSEWVCMRRHTNAQPGTAGSVNCWLKQTMEIPMLKDAWGNPIVFAPGCGMANVTVGGTLGHMISTGFIPVNSVTIPAWAAGTAYTPENYVVYEPTDPNQPVRIYRCIQAHTAAAATTPSNAAGYWAELPARPFFASAGPDGDFSKGDDNIYSFE
jgi:prepilin-type N-terminal cleavage/methylation domain-containing protein